MFLGWIICRYIIVTSIAPEAKPDPNADSFTIASKLVSSHNGINMAQTKYTKLMVKEEKEANMYV